MYSFFVHSENKHFFRQSDFHGFRTHPLVIPTCYLNTWGCALPKEPKPPSTKRKQSSSAQRSATSLPVLKTLLETECPPTFYALKKLFIWHLHLTKSSSSGTFNVFYLAEVAFPCFAAHWQPCCSYDYNWSWDHILQKQPLLFTIPT